MSIRLGPGEHGGACAGMVGPPRAAGVGKDEDALGTGHEGIGIRARIDRVRNSRRWPPSGRLTRRRVRPVISATTSGPNRAMMASSAGTSGGNAVETRCLTTLRSLASASSIARITNQSFCTICAGPHNRNFARYHCR